MKKIVSMVLVVGLLLGLCACSGGKFAGTWEGINSVGATVTYILKSNGTGMFEQNGYNVALEWEVMDENTIIMKGWSNDIKATYNNGVLTVYPPYDSSYDLEKK